MKFIRYKHLKCFTIYASLYLLHYLRCWCQSKAISISMGRTKIRTCSSPAAIIYHLHHRITTTTLFRIVDSKKHVDQSIRAFVCAKNRESDWAALFNEPTWTLLGKNSHPSATFHAHDLRNIHDVRNCIDAPHAQHAIHKYSTTTVLLPFQWF